MRRRRWLLFALLGISLVLLIVASALFIVPQLTAPKPRFQATPTTATTLLPAADAARIQTALNSPDMHVQASVLVPQLASEFLAKGQPAYPPGSTVKVLQGSSKCKDSQCIVDMIVTQPGGKQTTFQVYLTNTLGRWLIFQTQEIR